VPWKDAGWIRKASRGTRSRAGDAATFAVSSRSGAMSSRTQKERPWVAMTRSPLRIEMSRTEQLGRFPWSGCQWSPLSKETKMPVSVPAKSRPRRSVSSRTTLT